MAVIALNPPREEQRSDCPRVTVKPIAAKSLDPIRHDECSHGLSATSYAPVKVVREVSQVAALHRTAAYLNDGFLSPSDPLDRHLRSAAFILAEKAEAAQAPR